MTTATTATTDRFGTGARRAAPTTEVVRRSRTLLTAGLVAGPLFFGVVAALIATRDGFDLSVHPISLLATGPGGWVQILNFVIAGLLVAAAAVGMGRVLAPGAAARWTTCSVGLFGLGLVASGLFVADPENGFPAGTPAGPATQLSWPAIAHATAATLAYTALTVGIVALSVRLARTGHPLVAAVNLLPVLAMFVLGSAPTERGASIRVALSGLVAFVWLAVVSAVLRRRAAA